MSNPTEAQKEAARVAGRYYYWLNRDLRIAQMKAWRDSHREYRAAQMRKWQASHREHLEAYRQRNRTKSLAQAKERRRIWRLTHPRKPPMSKEEANAKQRAYRAKHHAHYIAKGRERYHRNRDKEHERGRLYRERNRDALRIRTRAAYQRDRVKNLERARRWYQAHKAERAAKQKAYRAIPEVRARRLEQKRRWYHEHTRKKRLHSIEWHLKQIERRKARARAAMRWESKHLTNAYVRKLLCKGTSLRPEDFSPEIVRLARAKLRLLRAARTRKAVNEKHD